MTAATKARMITISPMLSWNAPLRLLVELMRRAAGIAHENFFAEIVISFRLPRARQSLW